MSAAQVCAESSNCLPLGNSCRKRLQLLLRVVIVGRGFNLATNTAFEAGEKVRSAVSRGVGEGELTY